MRVALAWWGGLEDGLALARLGGAARLVHVTDPATRVDPATGVPDFLVEEQAAALGLPLELRRGGPPAGPARTLDRAAALGGLAQGFRAFVSACAPPLDASFLGRFVDADLVADVDARGGWGAFRTFLVDGPPFRRRVDVLAGDAVTVTDGWRLGLGLRGC